MQDMQQTVFHNLSKSSVYRSQVKKISDRHLAFPKYRFQQLQNQFDLVDLHGKGKLSQEQIMAYLKDKYQWVNTNVLNEVFKTIDWHDGTVTKEEFCTKYLTREKKLFHEIKRLNNFPNWSRTQKDIFTQNFKNDPRVYVFAQVTSMQLFHQNQPVHYMDMLIDHENHQTGMAYTIQQLSHEADEPSFEVWLPAQEQKFFMKLRFLSPKNNSIVYGRSYVEEEIKPTLQKNKHITVDITLDNKIVGHCSIILRFQASMETVKKQLQKNRQYEVRYQNSYQGKIKQYEYLQFLWGMRYKSPQKISQLDVPWMLVVRTAFIFLLGVLGLVVHVYGRFEPLSLIIAVLLIRTREYVMLPTDRFMMTWLSLAAILLDVVWIVFASNHMSEISFFSLTIAQVFTYALIGSKGFLLAYLLFFQRSFSPS